MTFLFFYVATVLAWFAGFWCARICSPEPQPPTLSVGEAYALGLAHGIEIGLEAGMGAASVTSLLQQRRGIVRGLN